MNARDLPILASVLLAGGFATTVAAAAQDFSDLQKAKSPLVLEAQGNFYVGGDKNVPQTAVELGGAYGAGHVTNNQMYVEYMIPQHGDKVPVVMIHGGGLSANSWKTTPDGRMGWDEYFVRKGHPVYLPDQVARARSGFNQAPFNNAQAGLIPPGELPPLYRVSDEASWTVNRFGPKPGVPFDDTQFPLGAAAELSKLQIPSYAAMPQPNPTYKALSDLGRKVKGAVIVGHSESGAFPFEAALTNSIGIKGVIMLEGNCPEYSSQQVKKLADTPMLIMFGDHLDTAEVYPGVKWQSLLDGCKALVKRVQDAGGNAVLVHLPEWGFRGNSHMMMFDKNNLRIADIIMTWINRTVRYRNGGGNNDYSYNHGTRSGEDR